MNEPSAQKSTPARLRTPLQKSFNALRDNRQIALRIALIPVVWGLVLTGWFSLGKALFERHLPTVQQELLSESNLLARDMAMASDKLSILAADDRISAAENDQAEALRQRAMYEFSYLQSINDIYVISLETGKIWHPARALPLSVRPSDVQAVINDAGVGALPFAMPNNGFSLLFIHKHRSQPVAVAILQKPDVLNLSFGSTSKPLLLHTIDQRWSTLTPANNSMKAIAAPDLNYKESVNQYKNSVFVVQPIQPWRGWWLGQTMSVVGINRMVFMLQLSLLLCGLVLTILLLWEIGENNDKKKTAARLPFGLPSFGRARPLGFGGTGSGMSGRRTVGEPIDAPLWEDDDDTVYTARGTPSAMSVNRAIEHTQKDRDALTSAGLDMQEKKKQLDKIHDNRLLQKIRTALAGDGLHCVYQPIYQASSGTPMMHEVLMRLKDDFDGSDLPNGQVITLAKRHNIFPEIDAKILQKVLAEHFGHGQRPVGKMCLNISSTTFDGLTYMQELMNKIDPSIFNYLIFELRSRELLADRSAIAFLHELRDMGAQLSVDYFGGGRKMLEASLQLGFEYVKIDATQMWDDLNKRRELIGLSRIANNLKIPLILEKVETIQVEVFARRIGIPYLQGYHFARPAQTLTTTILPSWRDMAHQQKETTETDAEAFADA